VDNGQVSDETSTDTGADLDTDTDTDTGTGIGTDTGKDIGGETGAEGPPPEPPEPSLPPRRAWLFAIVAPVVLIADIITKIVAVSALDGQPPVRVLGGLFYLQLVRNPGAAFGMATGMTWLLTLIAVAVVVAIIWIMPKLRSIGWAIGLALVLAGALGNLIDRFLREPGPLRGHVVDFLSPFAPNGDAFPVFNVADSSIVCGGALIVLMALLGRDYDGRSTRDKKQ
jgi:signal peptidase II